MATLALPEFWCQCRKQQGTGSVWGPGEEHGPEYLLDLLGGQGAKDTEVDFKFWYILARGTPTPTSSKALP